jgi:hypothetical protein
VLRTLAAADPGPEPGPGSGRAAAVDPETLRDRLDWLSPRRTGRARDTMVGWALDDAARLGVVGADALAPQGRALLEHPGDPGPAAQALDAALPETVDHVLLQADLTAVAPGPAEPVLARELALMADVESRGGATVYRFGPASVRRALDAGRTADELLELLSTRSRTPVPQPLAYLVADVARRHGRVRVGAAQAFVRADDESALTVLLADRRAAALRLRRLAPTVLAAQATPATVLGVLRELGLAPVAEGPEGDVLITRRERHRTGPRAAPRPASSLLPPVGSRLGSADGAVGAGFRAGNGAWIGTATGIPPSTATEAALATVVATVRAADRLAEEAIAQGDAQPAGDGVPPAPAVPQGQSADVIARLRQAAVRRESVWIGYADAEGRAAPRLVQPLQLDGGQLQALDRASQRVRTFVVHRVTGVTAATP